MLGLDKWVRLKAIAEPIRKALAILVDGYRWGLHLKYKGLYAWTCIIDAADVARRLGLSPRVYVYGGKYYVFLFNADTWKLIGWAAQRDPGLLEKIEAYLRRWLDTKKARAAERELRKLASMRGQR